MGDQVNNVDMVQKVADKLGMDGDLVRAAALPEEKLKDIFERACKGEKRSKWFTAGLLVAALGAVAALTTPLWGHDVSAATVKTVANTGLAAYFAGFVSIMAGSRLDPRDSLKKSITATANDNLLKTYKDSKLTP